MKSIFFEVRKSGISGKGIFCKKRINKHKQICIMSGKLFSIEEMIDAVDRGLEKGSDPLGVGGEIYLDLDEMYRTFNHSCNPNAFIKGTNKLIALREIEPGEEITFDYSTTMNDNEEKIKKSGSILWTCKCRCISKDCRGIIDQFKTLPKKRRDFYIKNGYAPDFILKAFGKKQIFKRKHISL